jgi:hypothetical protein
VTACYCRNSVHGREDDFGNVTAVLTKVGGDVVVQRAALREETERS